MKEIACYYNKAINLITTHLDGVISFMLRLYIAPIMITAGLHKLHGENWFSFIVDQMPFPFNVLPTELSWVLAYSTELFGGILLILGLGTRIISLMLAVTMFVAMYSVHWDHGWWAIAPSNSSSTCLTEEVSFLSSQYFSDCVGVTERTVGAAERLSAAKNILREHGNYSWLTENGSIAILNNGVEFAVTYMIMLLALVILGGGRYFSLDHWITEYLRRRYAHCDKKSSCQSDTHSKSSE